MLKHLFQLIIISIGQYIKYPRSFFINSKLYAAIEMSNDSDKNHNLPLTTVDSSIPLS